MIETPLGTIDADAVLHLSATLTQLSLAQKPFSRFSQALPERITVDAHAVRQCDSAGVAALIWWCRYCRQQNARLVWRPLPASITELAALYQIDFQAWTEYAD